MDIRTTRRLIVDYLQEFKGQPEGYVPHDRLRVNDKKYWALEVAQREGKIMGVRLVMVEELSRKYGITLSKLNE